MSFVSALPANLLKLTYFVLFRRSVDSARLAEASKVVYKEVASLDVGLGSDAATALVATSVRLDRGVTTDAVRVVSRSLLDQALVLEKVLYALARRSVADHSVGADAVRLLGRLLLDLGAVAEKAYLRAELSASDYPARVVVLPAEVPPLLVSIVVLLMLAFTAELLREAVG